MNKYIILDTETGGIGLDKSLLTAYFAVLDENFQVTAELDFKVKPDDSIYRVVGKAMGINRINLAEHDKIAMTYTLAKPQLFAFLSFITEGGKIKLVPIGHNVAFDINGVCNALISKASWDNFVSYRTMDTGSVAQFLIASGLLDGTKTSGSMESLGEYFGITAKDLGYEKDVPHDARYDTLKTRAVFLKLQMLIDQRR